MCMLKFSLICCMALILVVGCASEKKMEKTAETAQEAAEKPAAAAEAPAADVEEIALAVTGMT